MAEEAKRKQQQQGAQESVRDPERQAHPGDVTEPIAVKKHKGYKNREDEDDDKSKWKNSMKTETQTTWKRKRN